LGAPATLKGASGLLCPLNRGIQQVQRDVQRSRSRRPRSAPDPGREQSIEPTEAQTTPNPDLRSQMPSVQDRWMAGSSEGSSVGFASYGLPLRPISWMDVLLEI